MLIMPICIFGGTVMQPYLPPVPPLMNRLAVFDHDQRSVMMIFMHAQYNVVDLWPIWLCIPYSVSTVVDAGDSSHSN
jgi:hypothetical protein